MINRYQYPVIEQLWHPTSVINRWATIEIAAMAARGISGSIRGRMMSVRPTPYQVRRHEMATNHEFVAFLQAWRSNISDAKFDCPPELHAGLTSSDVIDTGQALALIQAHDTVLHLAGELVSEVEGKGAVSVSQIGRTHGQYAEPYPAWHPWEAFGGMLYRQLQRLGTSRDGILLAKLSGPVGRPDPETLDVESTVLRGLGLFPCDSTQIVPRDGLAHWVGVLAGLATICEAIATRVRLWSQSGVDEYHEATGPGQVGSSAMAHKQHNPILSENICGLARMARVQAETLQLGVVQWWDRDLAHSSVERVMLPDLCHLTCTILERTRRLVSDLVFNEDHVAANLQRAESRKEAALSEGIA